jgi:hypothetical protein
MGHEPTFRIVPVVAQSGRGRGGAVVRIRPAMRIASEVLVRQRFFIV